MISFAIVLFFSVTGLTLNHADYFAGALKTTTEKGMLHAAWVNPTDTTRIAKLEVVEYLRKTNQLKGELSSESMMPNAAYRLKDRVMAPMYLLTAQPVPTKFR
jgi:hypothetical protein